MLVRRYLLLRCCNDEVMLRPHIPPFGGASTVPAADQLLAAASTFVLLQQKHDIATKDPKQSVLLAAADIPSSPSVAAAPSSSPAGCSSDSSSSNSTSSSSTEALSAAAHSSQQQPTTVEVAATATRGRQQQEQAAPASASAQQSPSHIKPRSAEKAVGEPPFPAPPPQPHPFGNKIMKAPVPMTLGDLFALVSGDLAETRTAIHALAQSLAKETGISLPKATSAACGDFRHVQQHMQVAVTGSAVASSSSSSSSSSKSYAEAANTATFEKLLCSMPVFAASINGKRFVVNADSGCESSTISKSELECRWDDLFAPGSKVRLIHLADPVAVSMYAGGHTVYATQVVANVPLDIGIGRYYVDMLVVPDCGYQLTTGLDFMAAYSATISMRGKTNHPAGRRLTLAAPKEWLQPGKSPVPRPAWAANHWYPKTSVQLNYQVKKVQWKIDSWSTPGQV